MLVNAAHDCYGKEHDPFYQLEVSACSHCANGQPLFWNSAKTEIPALCYLKGRFVFNT